MDGLGGFAEEVQSGRVWRSVGLEGLRPGGTDRGGAGCFGVAINVRAQRDT